MLRSLLKGVGMGAGMGVGQEIAGTLIQHVRNRRGAAQPQSQPANAAVNDIQCGKCGEINTADSKFCGGCGNSLVARINLQSGVRCSCGYINCQGQKFCSECGSRLNG